MLCRTRKVRVRLLDVAFALNSQVSDGQVARLLERALGVDDLVDTVVGVEGGLDVLEDHHRAVRTGATKLARREEGGGETDGVVEGETKRLVRLLAALAAVEEALLQIIDDCEEGTARRVCCCVHTVGACDAAGECAYRIVTV